MLWSDGPGLERRESPSSPFGDAQSRDTDRPENAGRDDVIDPSRLSDAFEGPEDGTVSTKLSFTFAGFDVTVTDEEVRVRETADD